MERHVVDVGFAASNQLDDASVTRKYNRWFGFIRVNTFTQNKKCRHKIEPDTCCYCHPEYAASPLTLHSSLYIFLSDMGSSPQQIRAAP